MTRRQFLRTGVIGGALASSLPSFLDQTLFRLEAAERNSPLQRLHGKDAPILILMQLAGGNDGLNTVIPLENDFYHQARPKLGSVVSNAHTLNGELGLHQSLTGLKALYDDGYLSVFNGIGYPNPNRSHFRSTEIWHTASPEGRKGGDGWVGRYFDNQCQGMPAEVGISLTRTPPQVFQGPSPGGITFQNPKQFSFDKDDEPLSGASVGMATGRPRQRKDSPLHFLERTDLDARVSSEHLHATLKKTPPIQGFPNSQIANDLSLVARMIGGGMSTRIYYVSQGGFDTHANQLYSHSRLLKDLGDAQKAFWDEMKRQGNTERVQMLVFSEFGRRVNENGSGGTDHGAGAPAFVLGGKQKGGVIGKLPSLNPKDLHRGDVQHHTDFRRLYATVIDDHLQADSEALLGKNWSAVKI